MRSKWSVIPIIKDHYKTLTDARTGEVRKLDYIQFVGIPVVVGVFCFWREILLNDLPSVLAGVAVFTALLFNLLVHVSSLGMGMKNLEEGEQERKMKELVNQLNANVSYAIVIGLSCTTLLVVMSFFDFKKSDYGEVFTGLAIGFFAHLLLTMLMVLKRINYVYFLMRD